MSSAVADLEASLQAMLSLKPPGVSGSRIQSITSLCIENVQSESVLIQKLYTHFKKAPGTHKLGVLYVVDSVTRKWTELAKNTQQTIDSSAPDGTFAAGVNRVKELLPVLMNDIIQSSPFDQKEKIKKLVDIWEKGQIFPPSMLNAFKAKLNAITQNHNESTTPPGSPPDAVKSTEVQAAPPASTSNTSSILAALTSMARQANTAQTANTTTSQWEKSYGVANIQNNPAQQNSLNPPAAAFPPMPPSVNMPALASLGGNNGSQTFASNPTAPAFPPAPPMIPPTILDPAVQQQLLLIKALSDQGIPPDKIASLITALGSQSASASGAAAGLPLPFASHTVNAQNASWGGRAEESRDRDGYPGPTNSPPGRYRRRSRSTSPARGWNSRDSPASRRRDGPSYEHGRESPSRDERGRGREYRQRSPARRGRSPSPPAGASGEKWIGMDTSIGKGNIKVLSRTLFVGGVTCSEAELRSIFDRFGKVQTCIVNKEKRHAFVKMISRADAVAAREGMDKSRNVDSQLRTRWGVGFGPRECSDYQTGVSIIPISKLTDADRKWMLTAEYGGSGGRPIESGMVVEEPDIEIGQGVSSKAISRRMQTDKSGHNGPKSGRDHDDDDRTRHHQRDRDGRRGDDDRDHDRKGDFMSNPPSMPAVPPFTVPGFPYGIPGMPTLPNGMPMFPPGFTFPGQTQDSQQQPPPPGYHRS